MAGKREPHMIEAGEWEARSGRPRALVENPDAAQLWAYAEILREAGYEVATCAGEHPDGADRCPFIETGHCSLVEGADVVVSTCSVGRGDRLLAVLGLTGSTPVVFEAPKPDFRALRAPGRELDARPDACHPAGVGRGRGGSPRRGDGSRPALGRVTTNVE